MSSHSSDSSLSSFESRRAFLHLPRADLQTYQLGRLNALLRRVLPANSYYRNKLQGDCLQLDSLNQWQEFPLSTKSEWLATTEDGVAKHHTYWGEQAQSLYHRYHRTSGTHGRPMVIQDTKADWEWWTNTWQYVLDACQIESSDRILMAFSFGPFIGFWSAHDACLKRDCLVIPSGGMSTVARLEMIRTSQPSVLFATPSYALHLAQAARERGQSLRDSSIRIVFVAGEPGGSIPSVRAQIEQNFGARVMDHAGATEIGPWGFGASDGNGLHVIESEFIAEFLPLEGRNSGDSNSDYRELVLTSLGRVGAPVLRYRTGDIVKPRYDNCSDTTFVELEGGILGRADDMFVVRGVNLFPSSIEAILRQFESVKNFRINLDKRGAIDEVTLDVDVAENQVPAIEEALQVQLGLRISVRATSPGSLPASEGKAKRVQKII
ncbi:phenylacetate--CoA ligase family protein [Pirellulaceae bacterium SH449]